MVSSEAVERSEIQEPMLERPLRAPEVELVGRMPDTAFDEDHWLICYGGSHYIQATKLLYHVLLHCDGETPLAEIARRVSEEAEIELTTDQIRWLVENRLSTSGLLVMPAPAESDPVPAAPEPKGTTNGTSNGPGAEPVPATAPPVKRQESVTKPRKLRLGIRSRVPLLPYKITAPITGVLQHLYWPPLMVAAVILSLGINVWLFRSGDVLGSVQTVLFTPKLALLIFAIDLGMRLFHEFGHAAALRRAGVGYGTIGFAFLIIWPVFYTDVTHAYRLNRAQRIRVDLGGMYFQLYVIIGLYLAYLLTGQAALLVAIVVTGLSILEQFTPLIRFDGYYAAADILGIPEPMSLIVPYVSDHLPWRRHMPKRLPPMRPFARIGYAVYLLLMVAFIIYPVFFVGIAGNALMGYIVESGKVYWHEFVIAWLNHDVVLQIISTLQLFMWLLMPLGFALLAFRLLQGMGKAARSLTLKALDRWSPRRILATWGMMGALLLGAAGMAVPNAYAWASRVVEKQASSRVASIEQPVIQPIVPGSPGEQTPGDSASGPAMASVPSAGQSLTEPGSVEPLANGSVSQMVPMPVVSNPAPRVAQSAPPFADAGSGQGLNPALGSRSGVSSQNAVPPSNPAPVDIPAPSPTPGPSPALSPSPTPGPTPEPSPTPTPTPAPSSSPTPTPTPAPTPAPSTSLLSPLPSKSKSPPPESQSSNPSPSSTPSPALGSAQSPSGSNSSNSGKKASTKNDSSNKPKESSSTLPAAEPPRGKAKTSLLAPK